MTDCKNCKIFIGNKSQAQLWQRANCQLLLHMQALSMDLRFSTTAAAARSLLPVSSFKPRTAKTLSLVSSIEMSVLPPLDSACGHHLGIQPAAYQMYYSFHERLCRGSGIALRSGSQLQDSNKNLSSASNLYCRHLLLHSAKHHRVQCHSDRLLDGSLPYSDSSFCCRQP